MGDAPSAGHVRFRVQICGVCHSDLLGVESQRRIHRRWPLLATRTVQRRMRARAKQITLGVVAEPDRASHQGVPHANETWHVTPLLVAAADEGDTAAGTGEQTAERALSRP
jgi:hypothetical protein